MLWLTVGGLSAVAAAPVRVTPMSLDQRKAVNTAQVHEIVAREKKVRQPQS